jgi:hypothetical protein
MPASRGIITNCVRCALNRNFKMVKTVKNVKNFCKIIVLVWCYVVDFWPVVPKACNYRCMCCRTYHVSGHVC